MTLWSDVRQAWFNPPDGIKPSLSELSRRFGPDYRVIKKMLNNPEPPGYCMKKPRSLKSLKPHHDFIQEILDADVNVRRKQRHTAARIYERLCKERGYEGSERAVRYLVAKLKEKGQEVFIPLAQPKSKGQADLCEADVEIGGVLTRVYIFVMALAYSDAIFAMAFPFKKKEAWLEGHKQAFNFFGGVPASIELDNDKTMVSKILSGHNREMTDDFRRLVSFYCFKPYFCNTYRGNEKGIVENANKYIERHFLTPIPKVRNFNELNANLLQLCTEYLSTTAKGKEKSRGELLKEEQPEFIELPSGEYDACVKKNRKADSLSLVSFESNRYSVPDKFAGRDDLILNGYWDRVEIFSREKEHLTTHPRLYGKHEESLDPLHYLKTLVKKPGAIDYGRPFEKLQLPECFNVLRKRLEREAEMEAERNRKNGKPEGGKHRGTRKFIEILKLLLEFPMQSLKYAVEKSLRHGYPQYELIKQYCYPQEDPDISTIDLTEREDLAGYKVNKPELGKYDGLLNVDDNLSDNNFNDKEPKGINHEQITNFTGPLFERTEAISNTEGLQVGSK